MGGLFHDKSTAVVMPTRGLVRAEILAAMLRLRAPLGFLRPFILVPGLEVAAAYNEGFRLVLDMEPRPSYILTIEDDMLPEPNAHLELLRSIDTHDYALDAVAAFYRAKNEEGTPMCFGNDCRPMEPPPGELVRVSAVPFGFTLWRTSVFEKLPAPWFKTVQNERATMTHDIAFAVAHPELRLGTDAAVRCGHIDLRSGKIY